MVEGTERSVDADRICGSGGQPGAGTAVAVVLPVRDDSIGDVFVGRDEQSEGLALLLGLESRAVTICVAGMGGVGKTALALRVAGASVAAGRFRGRAFSVDMQGYRPDGGLAAESVLRPLLRSLGVAPLEIPVDLGEQIAVYHQLLDRLDRAGEPVLLVLDNVAAADRIRLLLPLNGAHRVVVTTRDTLDLPGARAISLDVPSVADATALLGEAVQDLVPGDARIADDPQGTRELVRTCGRLPLALRIVAALLSEEPGLSPGGLAGELGEAGITGFVHGEQALAAVLNLSWQRMLRRNRAAARLLRLLCLSVGPHCSTEVAVLLNGVSKARTLPLLRTLRQAHLLGHVDQRWQMHDLVRAHTETQDVGLTDAGFHAAGFRLVDHYTRAAEDAVAHLTALPDRSARNRFVTREAALSWLDAEYSTLLAVAHKAAELEHHDHVAVLCSQLTAYQTRLGLLTDRLLVARLAYAGANLTDVAARRADLANNLGIALAGVGLLGDAIGMFESAIAVNGDGGNDHGAAKAWNNLGNTLKTAARHEEAVQACRAAVSAYRKAGDRRKEVGGWINLGGALSGGKQREESIQAYRTAIELGRAIEDHRQEAIAWRNLADVLLEAGRPDDALAAGRTALEISREKLDNTEVAAAWAMLGYLHRRLGDATEADIAYRHSIELEEGEIPTGTLAERWTELGHAKACEGDLAEAAAAHRQAVRTYRRIGDWHGEAMTSNNLGHVLADAGDWRGASEAHQTALRLTRDHDDLFGQAMSHASIGSSQCKTAQAAVAAGSFRDAAALFGRIGDPKHEASAWLSLGLCQRDRDPGEARIAGRKALAIHTESNDEEGIRAAVMLLADITMLAPLH